jgi:hypothetical protein
MSSSSTTTQSSRKTSGAACGCKGLLSLDCFKCKGLGFVENKIHEAGQEQDHQLCPECAGLKISPCYECCSPLYSRLFTRLKERASSGADLQSPVSI